MTERCTQCNEFFYYMQFKKKRKYCDKCSSDIKYLRSYDFDARNKKKDEYNMKKVFGWDEVSMLI